MPDLLETANSFRRSLLKKERRAALRLITAYGYAWSRIERELTKLNQQIKEAREDGEVVNIFWLQRQQRYVDLLSQVNAEFKKFSSFADEVITKQQGAAVKAALSQSAILMETAAVSAGISATFNTLPVSAVENLVGTLGSGAPLRSLLDQLPLSGRAIVEQGLIEGVALGRNPRAIASEIRKGLGGNLTRALTISRTETLRAFRNASLTTYQANSDIIRGWRWNASKSRRSCLNCLSRDGSIYPLTKPMPAHPRCIPAGAFIHAPGVQGSTARWYEGELVEFETVGGYRLSVTPNHPILTAKGWIAAGLLNEGDEVVSARLPERVIAAVDPHKYHIPSRIEEIVGSGSKDGGMVSIGMPTAPEDFHGDGKGSEVHVINMHSLLGDGFDSSLFEPFAQQDFVSRHVALDALLGDGSLDLLFQGVFADAGNGMGGFGVSPILFRCPRCHHQTISVEDRAALDALFEQSAGDNLPGNIQTVGNGFFGFAGQISSRDVLGGEFNPFEVVAQGGPRLDQQAPDHFIGDTESTHQFWARYAGLVEFDQIRKLRKLSFSGHVYNLQTSTGWYIANNIITHNCRCSFTPILIGAETPQVQTAAEWFEEQPNDVKLEMMGPKAFELYRSGKVKLKDFEGERISVQWGATTYQRSVKEIQQSGKIAG